MEHTPENEVASELAEFHARMEEFKQTTQDPHWTNIDPAKLTSEDEKCWRLVQEDAISGPELRQKASEVMAGLGASIFTDTRSNFYAYLINVFASRAAKVELAKLRSKK